MRSQLGRVRPTSLVSSRLWFGLFLLTRPTGWPLWCLHPPHTETSQALPLWFSDSPTVSAEIWRNVKETIKRGGQVDNRRLFLFNTCFDAFCQKDSVFQSQRSDSWPCTVSAAPPGSSTPPSCASSSPSCPAASGLHFPQSLPFLDTKDTELWIQAQKNTLT